MVLPSDLGSRGPASPAHCSWCSACAAIRKDFWIPGLRDKSRIPE
jgi:hypothetical protein